MTEGAENFLEIYIKKCVCSEIQFSQQVIVMKSQNATSKKSVTYKY
jgi:hypothetical protein